VPALSSELEALFDEGARTLQGAAWDRLFRRIFESMRGRVYAIALHVAGRASDADDALQETFLAVYRCRDTFRGDALFSTWVYRIAIRAAVVAKRRRRETASLEQAATVADGAPRPDDHTASREEAIRLSRAMEQLSEEQRAVVALFAVDGLSHAQIAEVLGVPTGTIWSRLHVARKRLAEEMAGDWPNRASMT
jgi:RNA polymerase sigma-70 factor (ECF subfamily)